MSWRSVSVSVFLVTLVLTCTGQNGSPRPPDQRAYVDFAMRNDGDASRGRQLFANEQKTACTKCHSIDGTSGQAGPDLAFVGDKFPGAN